MNLSNPYSKDELDCLVREALQAWVGPQEPPERVWKRIKLELAPDRLSPRRPRIGWLSLAAQSVLCLLLVMLGVVGLQMPQPSPNVIAVTDLPPVVASDEQGMVSRVIVVPVEPDLDLLKTFNRPVRQATDRLPSRVSETASLERRLLRSEPAFTFYRPAQEKMVVFSLPPEE